MVNTFRADITAVLVAGDEQYQFAELKRFGDYLIADVALHPREVHYLSGRMEKNEAILEEINSLVHETRQKEGSRALVFVYHGHGLRDGFCPDGTTIPYGRLADIFGFDFPFVFLNNCCYSGAAIPVFAERGILPRYGSVIASTQSYHLSYGSTFLDALVDSFTQRRSFRRKKLRAQAKPDKIMQEYLGISPPTKLISVVQRPTRFGIELDYLLFPKQAGVFL